MRIGIITILKVGNYGAELQAYALQRELALLGFDAEIIDYLHYKHPDFVRTRRARPLVKIGMGNRFKERLLPWVERVRRMVQGKNGDSLRQCELFHRTHTRLSSRTYRTVDALYEADHPYDVFMVGSDQVWNPRTNVSLEPYFLTFAPSGKKTISYASSFGVSSIPPHAEQLYAKWLKHIQYLSVREEQGVRIIRQLTRRTAEHVLDPTLLLGAGQWRRIQQPPRIDVPYVLLYDVVRSAYAVDLAKHIAALRGWSVVRISGGARTGQTGVIDVADAGPAEFVGLFAQAAFVVTNSFHGTAFSVTFRRPFFTVVPQGKSNTSRLHSFLNSVSLDDRLVGEGTQFPSADSLALDFSKAHVRLECFRAKSVAFLQKSLTDPVGFPL